VAIYSLSHSSIGRSTHAAGTAGAHIAYIARPGARAELLAERMPGQAAEARAWLDQAEATERKNGRVVDKIRLALPLELSAEQRAAAVRDFAGRATQGRAPWLAAIHDQGKDAGNPHCHLVIRDKDPETGKRVAQLSEKGSTERLRELWEQVANEHLARAQVAARIDRRTLAAQGIERAPTIHVGPNVRAMEARGRRPVSQVRPAGRGLDRARPVRWPEIDAGRTRSERNRQIVAANQAPEPARAPQVAPEPARAPQVAPEPARAPQVAPEPARAPQVAPERPYWEEAGFVSEAEGAKHWRQAERAARRRRAGAAIGRAAVQIGTQIAGLAHMVAEAWREGRQAKEAERAREEHIRAEIERGARQEARERAAAGRVPAAVGQAIGRNWWERRQDRRCQARFVVKFGAYDSARPVGFTEVWGLWDREMDDGGFAGRRWVSHLDERQRRLFGPEITARQQAADREMAERKAGREEASRRSMEEKRQRAAEKSKEPEQQKQEQQKQATRSRGRDGPGYGR